MEFSFNDWLEAWGRTCGAEEPAKGPGFSTPETPGRSVGSCEKHENKKPSSSRRAAKAASLSQEEWVQRSLHSAFSDAKKRSKLRKEPFSLTEDCIRLHLDAMGSCCSLTGIPFRRIEGVFRQPFRPSFDRIDSKKPYTMSNTRIVACCVNAAMNEWGVEILDTIARGRFALLGTPASNGSLQSLRTSAMASLSAACSPSP